MSANICCEGPLTNPDIILHILGHRHDLFHLVTVFANIVSLSLESEVVLMRVHYNILVVIIVEEFVPQIGIEMEGVVEHKLQSRVLVLDHFARILVELEECVHV